MKILIIASCFAPKNTIGAVRISKIAKYLIREGHIVTVISPALEDYDGIDNTLECKEFRRAKRITVSYSLVTTRLTKLHKRDVNRTAGSEIGNQISTSIRAKMYRLFRKGFSEWRDFEWTYKVKRIIRQEKQNYDIVFSSYPNVATHNLAWYVKRTDRAKYWIADFRDPIVLDSDNKRDSGRLVRRQSFIVNKSDLTTFVTQTGTKSFICYPEDKRKVMWLSNGFDPDDLEYIKKCSLLSSLDAKQIVFSYAGGLYRGERDCSPLFKAIHELIECKKIQIEDVRFDYAGNDYGILEKQANVYKLKDIIKDKGVITRRESISMQLNSDCVVVVTECYRDYSGALTGKIYEPIMMKKPILLIVNGNGKNSEPKSFVTRLNAGTVYEKGSDIDNIDMIKETIMNYLDEKRKTGMISSTMNEAVREEYNYEKIVRKLMSNIDSLE